MSTTLFSRILLVCIGALLLCCLFAGCQLHRPTVAGHVVRYGAANTPTKHFKPNRRY